MHINSKLQQAPVKHFLITYKRVRTCTVAVRSWVQYIRRLNEMPPTYAPNFNKVQPAVAEMKRARTCSAVLGLLRAMIF